MPDPINKLYNNLIKSGTVGKDEIGDFNSFANKITDPKVRTHIYNELIQRGLTTEQLGTLPEFDDEIQKYTAVPAPGSFQYNEQPKVQASGNVPGNIITSNEILKYNHGQPYSGKPENQGVSQDVPQVGDNHINDLIQRYNTAMAQSEKQPVIPAGTLGEVNIASKPNIQYYQNLAKAAAQKGMTEKQQLFHMYLQAQMPQDIESGAILESPAIAAVAPQDYIDAVNDRKQQVDTKNQYFQNASEKELTAAAQYQNKPQGISVTPNMVMGTPIIQTFDTGAQSPKAQQEAQLNDTQDKLDKLGGYINMLKSTDNLTPQQQQDLEDSKTAYNQVLNTYTDQANALGAKLKEYPYYIPRNDVNLLSKETGVPNAVYATLNNSIIGKTLMASFGQNPDFRNYSPSAATKMLEEVAGITADAPVFIGVGKVAEGLTNVMVRSLSKLPLSEEFAASLDNITEAVRPLIEEGKSAKIAYAKAFEQLPQDAQRVKAAFTAAQVAEQGLNLAAYNTANDILTQTQNRANATPGSVSVIKGKTYHVVESDGDKIIVVGKDGKTLTLTPPEYRKQTGMSWGEAGKSAAVGAIGGGSLPVVSELTNALMEGAGISAAAPKSLVELMGQSYSFAAAASLVNKGKLPDANEVLHSLYFLGGLKIGTKIPELADFHANFDKYFNADANEKYTQEQSVMKAMRVARALGSGEIQNDIETSRINEDLRAKSDQRAAKFVNIIKNDEDNNVIQVHDKEGNQGYVKNGAVIKDGKLVSTQEVPEVDGKTSFQPTVAVMDADQKTRVLPLSDLQVEGVQTSEDSKKNLSDSYFNELKTQPDNQSPVQQTQPETATPEQPAPEQAVPETQPETEPPAQEADQLPVDKDGNVQWDELLKQDPEKFVSEYSKKYGDKKTKNTIVRVTKNAISENLTLKDKLNKAKTITESTNIEDKIAENESYIQQLKQADESIKTVPSPEKAPVEAAKEVKPTNQSPDVGKMVNEQPKEVNPVELKPVEPKKPVKKRADNSVIAKSLRIDPTTPDEIALQYFIGGGKINQNVLTELYGDGSKSEKENSSKLKGERKFRLSYYSKDGGTIDEIAHNLWEDNSDKFDYTTQDYRDAIESAVNTYKTRTDMAQSLLDRYNTDEEKANNFGYTAEQAAEMQRDEEKLRKEEEATRNEEFINRMGSNIPVERPEGKPGLETPEKVQKEPWEMTKKEWNNLFSSNPLNEKEVQGVIEAKTPVPLYHRYLQSLDGTLHGTDIENARTAFDIEMKYLGDDFVYNKKTKKWEYQPAEAKKYIDKQKTHREYIKEAIAEGKRVPPEVLKDYPELQKEKQPWEMTKKEYVESKEPSAKNAVDISNNFLNKVASRNIKESNKRQDELNKKLSNKEITDKEYNREADKNHKEIYGWINIENIRKFKDEHKAIVEKALSEGKPVPEEVLKEYPELNAKADIAKEEKKEAGNKAEIPPNEKVQQKKDEESDLRFKLYSPTEDAISRIKDNPKEQKKGTPEQMHASLVRNGAKETELNWMGWDDFAKGKKKLSADEIENWVKDNKVDLQEVIKNENVENPDVQKINELKEAADEIHQIEEVQMMTPEEVRKELNDDNVSPEKKQDLRKYLDYIDKYESYDNIVDNLIPSIEETFTDNGQHGDTKYSDYKTPGGTNYKEFLMTIPVEKTMSLSFEDYLKKYRKIFPNATNVSDKEVESYYKKGVPIPDNPIKGVVAAVKNKETYKSPHWDEPNIVVHTRTQDFKTIDGKDALHLDELQSDWAKTGREKGFFNEQNEPKFTNDNTTLRTDIKPHSFILIDNENGLIQAEYLDTEVKGLSEAEIKNKLIAQANEYEKLNRELQSVHAVPDLPFKKQSQWTGLALKRMVQEAVQDGKDVITWVTGQQTADRYDLSKQVDQIRYDKNNNGTYELRADKGGKEIIRENEVKESDLEKFVGKDIAQKIINGEGKEPTNGDYHKSLSGLDLKIGGEWAHNLYDKALPELAKKLFKKYGVKVGMTKIVGDDGQEHEVHYMTLPEKLRVEAINGLPMFKKLDRPTPENLSDAISDYPDRIKKWRDEMSNQIQSIADELGTKVDIVDVHGLPIGIRKSMLDRNAEKTTLGIFDPNDGKVYVMRSNVQSAEEARRVLLHELVGHKGLRAALGKDFDNVLEQIYQEMPKSERDFIKKKYNTDDTHAIADEYLAKLAENHKDLNTLQKAYAYIRDRIRKVFGLNYSDNDINYLFKHAKDALKDETDEKKSPKDILTGKYSFMTDLWYEPKEHIKFSLKDKENKDEEDQYEKYGITPFMADMFKKSLADMLKPKNREAYSEVSDYIEGKAAEKGIAVTPVASTADLPEDLKKTKEAAVTDPKTGRNYVVMDKIKSPSDVDGALANGNFLSGASRTVRERAEHFNLAMGAPGEGLSGVEMLKFGQQLLREGADPYEYIQKVKDGIGISQAEISVVHAKAIEFQRATNKAEDDYLENKTPENLKTFNQVKAAEEEYDKEAATPKTYSSNMLKAWNAGEYPDLGTYSGLSKSNFKRTGKEVTPKEAKEAWEISDDTKKLIGERDEWKAKAIETMEKYRQDIMQDSFKDRKGYSKWARSAAGKVRKAALSRPGMFMAATPASIIWDGAVHTTAAALDASANLVDAINKGVDYIKNSDWYKNLSNADKNSAEEQFRTHHYNLFKDKVNLKELQDQFGNKKGTKFTPSEALRLWDYAKSNYIDNGTYDWGDVIHGLSSDIGLSPKQVIEAIATPKGMREITDKIYSRMRKIRDINTHAKNWLLYKDKAPILKYAQVVPRALFSFKVLWHGGVGMITHAGKMIFDPLDWDLYFKNFINQYRLMASKKYYNRTMAALEADPNYIPWLRAGLAIDPHRIYNDYQLFGEAFKKMTGLGERGFDILKLYRFDLANRFWSHLSNEEKADPTSLSELAKYVNHATGTVKNWKGEAWYNLFFFAPRLEVARWSSMFGDPTKAAYTFAKMAAGKDVKPGERAFAKLVARQAGTMLATYLGALAINQSMLKATGSKHRINYTNPIKTDFLKFHMGKRVVALDGGMVNLLGFIGTLGALAHSKPKMKGGMLTSQRQNILDALSRYASYKVSPFISDAWTQMAKETFSHNYLPNYKGAVPPNHSKYDTWLQYLTSQDSPFFNIPVSEMLRDIHEEMRNRGVSEANTKMIIHGAIYGVLSGGTGVRVGTSWLPKDAAQKELHKQYEYQYPDYRVREIRVKLANQYAKDHDNEKLREEVKAANLTHKDFNIIRGMSRETPFVRSVVHLHSIDGAYKVYMKSTKDEKEQLRRPLLRKIYNARKWADDKEPYDKMIKEIKK